MMHSENQKLVAKIADCRSALDDQVRHIINCHFDPEKGTPFWLEYAENLGLIRATKSIAMVT